MKFVAIVAISVAATLICSMPVSPRAAPSLRFVRPASPARAGVRSATTFQFLPFPSPVQSRVGNFVFSPGGTAYFTEFVNAVASFAPTGVLTMLSVPNAIVGSSLMYVRGKLWMFAYPVGVISVRPDGSARRWYQFGSANVSVQVLQMTYAPNGDIYIIASSDNPQTGTDQKYPLFRISNGVVTTLTYLPVAPLNSYGGPLTIAFGADGLLYFGYSDSTGASGIARLESSGSVTRFPIGQISSLIASRGNVYFLGPGNGLGRLTPAGAVSYTAFPGTGSIYPSALSVDEGGNLWENITSDTGTALYQFNVYTNHFNGPYYGSSNVSFGSPVVSPSDTIWTFLGVGSSANNASGFGVFSRSR